MLKIREVVAARRVDFRVELDYSGLVRCEGAAGVGVLGDRLPQLSSGIVDEIGCKIPAFGRVCDSGGLEKVIEITEIVWEIAWVKRVERWRSALAAAWHGGKRRHNRER